MRAWAKSMSKVEAAPEEEALDEARGLLNLGCCRLQSERRRGRFATSAGTLQLLREHQSRAGKEAASCDEYGQSPSFFLLALCNTTRYKRVLRRGDL
jgi:hypothetical protein